MKKRILSIIITLILVIGIAPLTFAGCSGGGDVIDRTENKKTYDFSDEHVIPSSGKEVSKTLNYIKLDGFSNSDLFMSVSLQGNVNKDDPSIYVIHDEMIEGPANFNSTQYWFDKLDSQYSGDKAFTKVEYTDPYELVKAFSGKVKGAVLYHERLVDALMTSRNEYSSRYADMAVLNLTVMMAAKYDAVALTYEQYNKLKNEYNVTLPIKADTTEFMEKDESGKISANRGSKTVWENVYLYALDTFKDFNRRALGHLAGNQAATMDFFIGNDIFVYNRIFAGEATEKQRKIEDAILTMSDVNTPVFGCWYLQADEGSLVPYLTENYKFFIVSYESFNWTWTTALPKEEFSPGKTEEKLVLDESKNYIAFTFTEGDNNSYVHFRMPQMMDNDPREEDDNYPIGWTMAPTVWETNPNIVKYYKDNWREGDSLAIPEAGVDYVYHCPPEESQDEYFALSDEYLKRVGSGVVRMLNPDLIDPLPFAEKMENLEGMMLGYYETNNTYYNSELANFMFRGKPFFTNYSGADVMSLNQAESQGPGFYSVTLLGWNQDASTVKAAMDLLGDNFVCVTPSQLVDLYKQKYDKEFNNITKADFDTYMTREEMGFLWQSSDYASFDAIAKSRVADNKNFFTYRFNFAENVNDAKLKVKLSGDYQIEASTDYKSWKVLGKGSAKGEEILEFDLSSFVKKDRTVYVRFGDKTTSDGAGANVYRIAVSTNAASGEGFSLDSFSESNLLSKGGKNKGEGRTGEFTYAYTVNNGISGGDLSIMGGGSALTVGISKDNKNFTPLSLSAQGGSKYAKLSGLDGKFYLKFNAKEPVTKLKFTPDAKSATSLNFSPVTNNITKSMLISCEDTSTIEKNFNSNRQITGDNTMIYRFKAGEGITKADLLLTINGLYKLEISNDNKTYTTLKSVNAGEDPGDKFKADVTSYAGSGKDIYIKISMSQKLSGKSVKLAKIRFITNLTPDWLMEKIDSERVPDGIISVESKGRDGDYGIDEPNSAEYKLLDQTLTTNSRIWMHNYAIPRRMLTDSKADQIVYKFDFSSDDFWTNIGVEKIDTITRFRVNVLALNGFNVSASKDGVNWTEVYDTNDVNVQSGANMRDFDFVLNDFVSGGNQTVYLRFKLSNVHEADKTHPGQWQNLKFYFN